MNTKKVREVVELAVTQSRNMGWKKVHTVKKFFSADFKLSIERRNTGLDLTVWENTAQNDVEPWFNIVVNVQYDGNIWKGRGLEYVKDILAEPALILHLMQK